MLDILKKYPEDVQVDALKEKIRQEYRSSLYKTAKHLLGYSDVNPRTHGDMIRALEAPTKRKLIVMPRGTFKSSVGSVAYPIWRMLNDPNVRILLDGEKYENSKNFIREIKGKLEDPKVTDLFGQFKSDSNWSEGSITIRQRTQIFKEATVTASGIGAGKTGQHYNVIIGDDYNSPQNSENPEQRKKIIDHYRMSTAILEPEGTIVVIGTRYAIDDAIGSILTNEVGNETNRNSGS